MAFMRIASQYYLNSTYTPIDKNSKCQKSYILVIGDGDWYNQNSAVSTARNLYNNHGISTFTVAFGTGISSSGLRNFNRLAASGGTTKAIIATTAESLKTQLQAAISQIIASKLSFTAPAITATLNSAGSLYQAQFDYAQNKEWTGTIKRTAINSKGILDTKDKGNWSALEKLPKPQFRKIWSAIPGTDYENSKYNNFVEANSTEIDNVFTLMKHEVLDYHNDSTFPNLMDVVNHFNEGRKKYIAGDFNSAISSFKECLKVNSDDVLSNTYIDRCKQLIEQKPKNWDGVWVMKSK